MVPPLIAERGHRLSPASPRILALLSQMTLKEKVGQLSQRSFAWADPAETHQKIREGRIGSILNAGTLEARNLLQKTAIEESRLKVPLLFGRDVIHGYRTIFPIPLGQAASFNPELVEQAAAIAAKEAAANGVDWTFAPMIDVARDPRWGRVAEGCGEDPYLTARMGTAMVRGFQGTDLGSSDRIAACAKHFVGYGAVESGKEYASAFVPGRLLSDVYLLPFEACVRNGVASVMTAFSDLDGVPMTANRSMVSQLLKRDWGFEGLVVSDWDSVIELVAHGVCLDQAEAAAIALAAGVDLEMASCAYENHLESLVESGQIPLEWLDEAVLRVLGLKERLELFTNPYPNPNASNDCCLDSHRALARQLAGESMVLLENRDSLLPLTRSVSVALVGPLVLDPKEPLGSWVFDAVADDTETIADAFRTRWAEDRLLVEPGLASCRSNDDSRIEAAVAAARASDVVVAVVGEDAELSGECRSRAFLRLPGRQGELLHRLFDTGKPVVVVILAGRPLVLGGLVEQAQALLYAWQPGTMVGPALVDLLLGDRNPSGRLPMSLPRSEGQIPVYYARRNTGRPPSVDTKGIPAGTPLDPQGYETGYLDLDVSPQYAFGFGLSYTRFTYRDLVLEPKVARQDAPITVRVVVENVGPRMGTEVAQLYVRDRVARVTRPLRELKGFQRVTLGPGEKAALRFELGFDELCFAGLDGKKITEPGTFDVFVGSDSRAPLGASFEWLE